MKRKPEGAPCCARLVLHQESSTQTMSCPIQTMARTWPSLDLTTETFLSPGLNQFSCTKVHGEVGKPGPGAHTSLQKKKNHFIADFISLTLVSVGIGFVRICKSLKK